jgi:hypothetical protein
LESLKQGDAQVASPLVFLRSSRHLIELGLQMLSLIVTATGTVENLEINEQEKQRRSATSLR